ncbi:hypothetical protein ILYODFUR_003790 [Ilyodon furcidens]|uniref:Uncharacterized protein n=1 Tax=Ilyodon furcidens TaxID=33524 RepID=A0ABV0SXN9_9TELE
MVARVVGGSGLLVRTPVSVVLSLVNIIHLPADGGRRVQGYGLYGSPVCVSLPQDSCGYNVAYHCHFMLKHLLGLLRMVQIPRLVVMAIWCGGYFLGTIWTNEEASRCNKN